MVLERQRAVESMLAAAALLPLSRQVVLDVGCGTGMFLGQLRELGADDDDLYGVDLMPDRIAAAQSNLPRGHFEVTNAESLDFDNGRFDLVILSTVLSSILDPIMRRNMVSEVARVTASSGAVLIYDFRVPSPGNKQVRAVTRRTVRQLFPGWRVQARSLTLLPPLARRLGRATDALYGLLVAVPFLRTHNLILLRRAG